MQKAKDQKRLKVAARWLRLGLIGGRSLAWRPFLGSAGRASLGPIILLETSCDLGLEFGDFSLDLGDLGLKFGDFSLDLGDLGLVHLEIL